MASTTPNQFSAGDLVVYETLGNTSASTAVSLVDYGTNGTPSGYSLNLPTADGGSVHALTDSGSALNDGELTDSGDGQSLVVSGYDAAPGVTKITSATGVARSVAIVSPTGTVDSTTSLSDSTSEGNNFRSATTAATGSGNNIYLGNGSGLGYAADGATSGTYLTTDNVHDLQVVDGQLYESTATGIYQVGSGLTTSASPSETPLVTGSNAPTGFDPDQFALVTLGSGTTPNTLYVADGAGGAPNSKGVIAGQNAVEKYSLVNGSWVSSGSVSVPLAVGLAVSVSGSTASLYVTGATADTASNNTVLYGITDSSGYDQPMTGVATTLATAPSGDDFHGVAFAPVTAAVAQTPEVPFTVSLPLVATALLGGGYLVYRRRYHIG